jgi:hypothetical protein
MGELSRRSDNPVPVQARRTTNRFPLPDPAPLDPIEIQIPPGQQPPVIPPPSTGVTQNIIYVTVPPPAQIVPPGGPIPPQEVHYHTTNNFAPIKRRRETGTSFFGRLAIVAGLLACGCAYLAATTEYVRPIAEAGLAMGALGLVISTLFGRSGRVVPVLGILISAVAFPLWFSRTGQLQSQYNQLRSKSQGALPALDLSASDSTGKIPGDSVSAKTPAAPVVIQQLNRDHSIFGDNGGWHKPGDGVVPTPPAKPAPGDTPPSAANDQTSASVTLPIATANLETARIKAAQRRGVDYAAAKAAAASAAMAYENAKIQFDLKSPELLTAGEKKRSADSQLRVLEKSLDSDPDVAAAEAALKAAKR